MEKKINVPIPKRIMRTWAFSIDIYVLNIHRIVVKHTAPIPQSYTLHWKTIFIFVCLLLCANL